MAARLKVACIQLCAGSKVADNLKVLGGLIGEAARDGAALVCLPEYTGKYGAQRGKLDVGAESEAEHPTLAALRQAAAEHQCWLLIGSLGIRRDDDLTNNRSFLIDPEGEIRARYDKIHLFDVDLAGGESYRESASIKPGASAVVVDTPLGHLGLSICYDLRFPQLYRTLAKAGAKILFVPAAFTRKTGKAHWHVLLRARAIETGCYVVAPAQCGDVKGKLARFGHALIVDPWGKVLADGGEEQGIITAELDLEQVDIARRSIPALEHDRIFEIQTVDQATSDAA
jgi:predicted amidohydrolase